MLLRKILAQRFAGMVEDTLLINFGLTKTVISAMMGIESQGMVVQTLARLRLDGHVQVGVQTVQTHAKKCVEMGGSLMAQIWELVMTEIKQMEMVAVLTVESRQVLHALEGQETTQTTVSRSAGMAGISVIIVAMTVTL
jgi:hypothetical protein